MRDRIVQQLRIRAARTEHARHAAIELEDALRTTSLPGLPANGVAYIRCLDLGRIGARPGRSTLARRIDTAIRSLPAGAIRRADAGSDLVDAAAVWFPDPTSALLAVVERLLRGDPLAAWYWRRVLDLRPAAGAAANAASVNLATVVDRAERLAPAEPSVLAVLRHVARRGALARLAAELPDAVLRRQSAWLETRVVRAEPALERAADATSARGSRASVADVTPSARVPALPLPAPALLAAVARRFPAEPQRAAWCMLVWHEAESARLTRTQWLRCREAIERRAREPAALPPSTKHAAPLSRLPGNEPGTLSAAALGDARPGPRGDSSPGAPGERRRPSVRPPPRTDFDVAGNWLWGGAPTAFAGLLFLLPIWRRLGLEAALREHAWLEDAGFVAFLVHRLGSWLALPADDPMLGWLPRFDPGAEGPWSAPPSWRTLLSGLPSEAHVIAGRRVERALAGRVWLSAEPREPADGRLLPALADSWLRLGARILYRHRLRVRAVVARAGAVAATATHLDVCLPLEHGDLAIRKAALDLDPGWFPPLGRVIHYHYVATRSADG